ncbi:MAG: hypothetical protein ACOVLD_03940 [Bacteroidia bacterium]
MKQYHNLYAVTVNDLPKMSREQLIEWLCWNDPNGVYRDEESMSEFGVIMDEKEAYWLALGQICN